jgi:hypothetical protein
MSLGLEFNISAKDQASAAVETVNKKIKDFGKDVAKSFLSFAAPLALMQTAFGAIGSYIEDYNKRMQEAMDNGAKLKDDAADLGVSVEVWQRLKGAADASGIAVSKVGKLYSEAVRLIEEGKDPLSDSARILRDALGFAGEDVAKGNLKAIDVIERMGKAISGATSETDAMNLATALLGATMAKELLPALREAGQLKAGFVDTEGLTEEEAAVLRAAKAEERRKKAREEFNDAKVSVTRTFLDTDPEGKKIAEDEFKKSGRFNRALARDEDVQKRVAEAIKKRAADEKAAKQAEVDAAAAAVRASAAAKAQADKQAEADKDKAKTDTDAKKETDKSKADADKAAAEKVKKDKKELGDALDAKAKLDEENAKGTGKLTVSSLREIGGGLAGEALTNGLDIQQKQLDISQSILIELQKLNIKTLPEDPRSIDFTKPLTLSGVTTFNA